MVYTKPEKFEISSRSTGITESDGEATNWADVWDFKVGLNQIIELRNTDIFCCYLDGDDSAEMPDRTRVRVVKRDVSNTEQKPILTEVPYKSVQEFKERKKLMRLTINSAMLEVGPEEHIVVQVAGLDATGLTGDLDASDSYFKLVTTRRRKPLS